MNKDKKEKRYYRNIQVESDEEVLTLMWFHELMEEGYIQRVERADTYILSAGLVNNYVQQIQMKSKVKEVTKKQVLLNGHVYTPEFKVVWNRWEYIVSMGRGFAKIDELFIGKLEGDIDDNVTTYMEVKPAWDQNGMERLFKINQKWMWDKYGIFVNLIHPHKLFESTFTPYEYLTTATGKERKINWQVRSADEWLQTLKGYDK